ncbi:hypothetical protein ACFOQM_11880 [Paenibacillus sp. GCM10012307]|uniref:Uncharacterized protein n=1 Tax=Paenibacillus roseus TaxID=2798579 RepID=A0A934J7V5_9BACL|nr:hypothetical protein [Paenibacillus roseus]MBJ6361985.1 hypothetical protein [Paenibacillus roseus]
MPYHYFHEIKTPLLLLGIRLMKDEHGKVWIKVGKRPRKLIYNNSNPVSNKTKQE